MNLKKVRSKSETEDSFVSITKNCETLIEQTHKKSQESLELKLTNQEKFFRSNHLLFLDLILTR